MENVYLLLGSNMGKPEENVAYACKLIEAQCGKIVQRSSLYKTAAWGITEQADFINKAINITTRLDPNTLLAALKSIENEMGRAETIKWGPRMIDIDILFYGDEILDSKSLKIPHTAIQDRRFALHPMHEIAPGFIHPGLKKTIAELLKECKDELKVEKLTG